MKITIIVLLIIIYLAITLLASKLIIKSHLSRKQITLQLLIAWLFPFIGGLVCILFNRKEKTAGSHINKSSSWTRLVKYDEHNEA